MLAAKLRVAAKGGTLRRQGAQARSRSQRIARRRAQRERGRKLVRAAKRLKRESLLSARRVFADENHVFFDGNLLREQIVLPSRFCLWSNFAESAALIERMRRVGLMENRSVMLHFDHVEHLDPAAALILVAEIHRIRNLRGRRAVHGTYPSRKVIYDLLSEMGFFQLLEISDPHGRPGGHGDPTKPVFLRFLTDNKVDGALVNQFVSVVEKGILPLNELGRAKLVGAIKEAMNNTLDHAHPAQSRVRGYTMSDRWWMSSSLNLSTKEVVIMLYDQGVGIPSTLKPDRYDRVRAVLSSLAQFRVLTATPTDGEVIMAATELYRTSTGQEGRGRGFRDMKRFVDVCDDGELRVLSNRGRYTYMKGTEGCSSEPFSLDGTLIEWRFRHDGSVEMNDD